MNNQFWGRIEDSGTLNANTTHSSNFSPLPNSSFNTKTGQYVAVLNEWVARLPNISATPAASAAATISVTQTKVNSQYQLTFYTFRSNKASNCTFYFTLDTGFAVPAELSGNNNTVTFTLSLMKFMDGYILVPKYNNAQFDKGTILDVTAGTGTCVEFCVVGDDSLDGYTIEAFSNGATTVNPRKWTGCNGNGNPTWTTPELGPVGTHLTLGAFTFTATSPEGTIYSTDPIARVRSVGGDA